MKIIITNVLILFALHSAGAQSIERKLTSAGGTTLVNGGYQLSFSIGETAVQAYQKGYDAFLTEGFQQAHVAKTGALLVADNRVSAYPNPAVDFVRLDIHGYHSQINKVCITDISGKTVKTTPFVFVNGSTNINLQGLPAGTYIVYVTDPQWHNTVSTKIIKEN